MQRSAEKRIPSLDGLRAISICLVLVGHLAGTRNFPLSVSAGKIRVSRFYLRRTLRIFPPYYTFLLALAAAAIVGRVSLAPNDLVYTLMYTTNYYADRSWFVGHTWSLSVEEQFYLLWPALLIATGLRRGLLCAAAFVLACPLIRLAEWEIVRSAGSGIGIRFETIADAIAIAPRRSRRPRLECGSAGLRRLDQLLAVSVAAAVSQSCVDVLARGISTQHPARRDTGASLVFRRRAARAAAAASDRATAWPFLRRASFVGSSYGFRVLKCLVRNQCVPRWRTLREVTVGQTLTVWELPSHLV